jgi:DNA-binding MarR family transcriptional regulator
MFNGSMRLEEEIGQKEFTSLRQKALINLFYTNNQVVNAMNDLFKSYQITRQQFNVLRILKGAHPDPVSINDIKCRMLDRMSDASRIVERLRIKKLVKRVTNKIDRRAVDVLITPSGIDLLEAMNPKVKKFEEIFNGLSENDLLQLNQNLDEVRNRLKQ